MASANEESKAMDDCNGESESSSLEEWTIIGDKESNDKISGNNLEERNINDDNEYPAAEEAREAIQILGESSSFEEVKDDKNRIESFVTRDEDSDGISVITDSDRGEDTFSNHLSKIIIPIQKIPPVGAFLHIIVACSLAAAVGFGIGCFVGTGKTQLPATDVNFGHAENVQSFDGVDELSTKTVDMPETVDSATVLDQPKIILEDSPWKRPINIEILNDNIGSFREIIEKVKLSLDTLCSIIKDGRKSKTTNKDFVCDKRSSILDLIDLKDNVENVITKTAHMGEVSNQRFIENMESRIQNISLTFLDNLSKTIKTSVLKIDRKLNKVRRKLNQRLCFIRNTIGDDPKVLEILSKQNALDENCVIVKFKRQAEPDSETKDFERRKKMKNAETNHAYPIGPEVESETDAQRSKMESKNHLKKQDSLKEEEYIKAKKKYRPRKDFSKGDFMSERESIDLHAAKDTQIHRPLVSMKNFKDSDKENDAVKVCQAKSCSKQRNNDRKNAREVTNEDWQFKRSEGRHNWRAEKEIIETSWDYNRARARESARQKL